MLSSQTYHSSSEHIIGFSLMRQALNLSFLLDIMV